MRTVERWTDEELGYLAANVQMAPAEVAEALGRSVKSVYHQRQRLRAGWEPVQPEAWTEAEDAVLLDSPTATAHDQAARLPGRTLNAVKHRRRQLAQAGDISWGSKNKSPWRMGSRPLIAKTCPGCGLLLVASWFEPTGNKQGGWRTRCKRCDPSYERKDQAHARAWARAHPNKDASAFKQKYTLERATRHRQEWTAADHEVLSDPDLSVFEKALKLGRTYFATGYACAEFGYPSIRGLGDPERDQWIIDNPNAERFAS